MFMQLFPIHWNIDFTQIKHYKYLASYKIYLSLLRLSTFCFPNQTQCNKQHTKNVSLPWVLSGPWSYIVRFPFLPGSRTLSKPHIKCGFGLWTFIIRFEIANLSNSSRKIMKSIVSDETLQNEKNKRFVFWRCTKREKLFWLAEFFKSNHLFRFDPISKRVFLEIYFSKTIFI